MLPDEAEERQLDGYSSQIRILTKREFFRLEMTSEGRVVATCGWVVVAESS